MINASSIYSLFSLHSNSTIQDTTAFVTTVGLMQAFGAARANGSYKSASSPHTIASNINPKARYAL